MKKVCIDIYKLDGRIVMMMVMRSIHAQRYVDLVPMRRVRFR